MQTIKLILHFWKLNILSAMEYKVSFIIQIIGMIVNDFMFFLIWVFFFRIFGTLGGLDIGKFAILLSIMVMVFGILHTFFNGYSKIGMMIEEGKLDNYMLLPKSLLVKLIVSSMMISAIGDILYSFLLMFLIPNLTIIMIFEIVFLSIIGSFTFLGFMLIFISLSFYIGSSRNIIRGFFDAILGPSHYPPGIFDGTILKYVFMTIIPVYFTVYGQFELVLNFTLGGLIKLILGSIFFLSLGTLIFYKGLKKYESGNIINVNV
ncbi:MAG: ABC-2 family transporter protein [Candidatus Gracilibacteria bacterium]